MHEGDNCQFDHAKKEPFEGRDTFTSSRHLSSQRLYCDFLQLNHRPGAAIVQLKKIAIKDTVKKKIKGYFTHRCVLKVNIWKFGNMIIVY